MVLKIHFTSLSYDIIKYMVEANSEWEKDPAIPGKAGILLFLSAGARAGGAKGSMRSSTHLVKALRDSSSEDADEADTGDTGGCRAENLFRLVALGRKESGDGGDNTEQSNKVRRC